MNKSIRFDSYTSVDDAGGAALIHSTLDTLQCPISVLPVVTHFGDESIGGIGFALVGKPRANDRVDDCCHIVTSSICLRLCDNVTTHFSKKSTMFDVCWDK